MDMVCNTSVIDPLDSLESDERYIALNCSSVNRIGIGSTLGSGGGAFLLLRICLGISIYP